MVMILSVLFLFSVVGCKADTPNIKELEGYWVSDHRCIKETDYNYSTRETFVWYQPQVIRIRESKFFDLGVKVKYICKSSCKKGITIVRDVDDEEFGTFIILKPDKIQFISEDNQFTCKDTYTRGDKEELFKKAKGKGLDDNRPK